MRLGLATELSRCDDSSINRANRCLLVVGSVYLLDIGLAYFDQQNLTDRSFLQIARATEEGLLYQVGAGVIRCVDPRIEQGERIEIPLEFEG